MTIPMAAYICNVTYLKQYPLTIAYSSSVQLHLYHVVKANLSRTSARPEVRGTADVGWRSLNPLPINPPRTHSRLYHHMFFRTDGR